MQTLAIDDATALVSHAPAVEQLFLECFGNRMSSAIWRWAYLENPLGHPWVSVCYDGDRMVGHYAMIALPVSNGSEHVSCCLSMTTMVAASHRQHGLFVKLATATYDRAKAAGVAWVMGFPNEMSAPGFERRLGWRIGTPDRVVDATRAQWLEHAAELSIDSALLRLDLRDASARAWRTSRPGGDYRWNDGLLWKPYEGGIDVLSYEEPGQLATLPPDVRINLLLPADHPACQHFPSRPYMFGGTDIARHFDPAPILRNMALSDLF